MLFGETAPLAPWHYHRLRLLVAAVEYHCKRMEMMMMTMSLLVAAKDCSKTQHCCPVFHATIYMTKGTTRDLVLRDEK
jgi:hypothetical protein